MTLVQFSPLRENLPAEKEAQRKKITAIAVAAVAVWALTLAAAGARAAGAHRVLKVKLNYVGATDVNAEPPIYVLLFDADPYKSSKLADSTSDAMPPAPGAGVSHIVRRLSTPHTHGSVTFDNLTDSTVYAMAFVDSRGAYDPHAGFPTGAPMVVYGKGTGGMGPISFVEGETRKVTLNFGDTLQIR